MDNKPCAFYDDVNHKHPTCILKNRKAKCKRKMEKCDLVGGEAEVVSIDELWEGYKK